MAFSVTEKMFLARIVKETYGVVTAQIAAMALDAERETAIKDRMDVYEPIQDSHVKLSGEVDFDNERKRESIRQELRKALGLPLFSEELGGGGSTSIRTVAVF